MARKNNGEKVEGYKKMNGSKWITKERRLAIYMRDNFVCAYCGEDLRKHDRRNIGLDHLTPRYSGGSNDSSNLVTVCKACNSSRGTKDFKEYATGGALLRIEANIAKEVNVALAKSIIAGTATLGDEESVR